MSDADEDTPLLRSDSALSDSDPHHQFCLVVGVPPSNVVKKPKVPPRSLYGRATHQYRSARRLHAFMASLSTTALLAQVVIGAAVTALGASQSSHILITVFGATNTVIAGIVAYLKSRGQPMRTRMFRDDLQRVVDEIENSETMWLGITKGIHGYDEIDIDDKVTVRSEVARLMRLYERAVRNNTLNNPDNYLLANSDAAGTALRARAPVPLSAVPPPVSTAPAPSIAAPAAPPAAPAAAEDPDESPASAPPRPPTPPPKEESKDAPAKPEAHKDLLEEETPKEEAKPTSPSAAPSVPADPDESPASSANPPSIPDANADRSNGQSSGLSSDTIAGSK